ncbi:MAG: hypothetical protein ABSB76_01925 [Streptosporangiaceae bacterium]
MEHDLIRPNDMPGQRSAAAAAGISSAGTPNAVKMSYILSWVRAGPKSTAPVVKISSCAASSESSRHRRCAAPVSRT